jgi:biotin synthase
VAIQGGERSDSEFIEKITRLVWQIRHLQKGGNPESVMQLASEKASTLPLNNLGITLSLGEQPKEVYREWKKAGATRYLLRIETSNKELYEKIHPGFALTGNNAKDAANHSMLRRLQALADLKSENYLLGSGVMIGLPFQTYEHLQEDLQFLQNLGVDMVGMGPYIPHYDTPLGQIVSHWRTAAPLPDNLKELASQPRGDFWNMSNSELLEVSLQMVARLRILLPDINIAATTALQVLDPMGREQALLHGANVIMPNMSETQLRGNYSLYQGKQGVEDDAVSTRDKLLENLSGLGISVGWDERGDRR